MFDRLDDLLIRYEELMEELGSPEVASDTNRFRKLMKEQSDLAPIVEAYKEYKKAKQDVEDSLALLDEESDEEMREMAKEELNAAKKRIEELEQELKILLLPKDPNDEKNVIVEIQPRLILYHFYLPIPGDGQYPADRLRLVISYLKIYAAALVQMFAALQRQNPVKIQTVLAAVQRQPRLMVAYLRFQTVDHRRWDIRRIRHNHIVHDIRLHRLKQIALQKCQAVFLDLCLQARSLCQPRFQADAPRILRYLKRF